MSAFSQAARLATKYARLFEFLPGCKPAMNKDWSNCWIYVKIGLFCSILIKFFKMFRLRQAYNPKIFITYSDKLQIFVYRSGTHNDYDNHSKFWVFTPLICPHEEICPAVYARLYGKNSSRLWWKKFGNMPVYYLPQWRSQRGPEPPRKVSF